jgi:DNA-binding transcriptional regulator YdaS (Cro superfamily)
MNIPDYLADRSLSQQAFAALVGVTQSRVSQWISGERVPAERVLAIEFATAGAVTRYDLRPDLFGVAPAKAA